MENQFATKAAKIKVIGVGGGGNNAINRMYNENVQGVEFYVANTDAQVLGFSSVPNKIILGEESTKGLGAGADPEVGKKAALESEAELREHLSGADLIFIAAGMGGGTGTGAAPVIARIAAELGALVIGIVTKPFIFEGRHRINFANQGISELRKHVDSIIVISNDKLLDYIGGIPINDSFKEADAVLKQGVQTITDLIAVPAIINLDFADVRTVMRKKGSALFGIGIGSGEDKANEAANKAISSSLLEASIRGSKDIIVNITGGKTISLNDAYDVIDVVTQSSHNPDVNIVFGLATNEDLTANDEIIVTVIATGFEDHDNQSLSTENQVENKSTVETKKPSMNNEQPIFTTSRNQNKEEINETMSSGFDDDDFPTFLK